MRWPIGNPPTEGTHGRRKLALTERLNNVDSEFGGIIGGRNEAMYNDAKAG